jgi:5-histidylcysteine sulfoxide synthase/putative 4-mercaptohistidine N1-methyltranferase
MTLTRNPNLTSDTAFHPAVADAALEADGDPLIGERPDWWWTGPRPEHGICPGVDAQGRIHSLPLVNLATCTREEVFDYFANSWALNEVLLSAIQGEENFKRPPYHQLRHPMLFYYGHTVVFYVNKLRVAGLIDQPINPFFEQLFEVGVDEMSWDDMSKNEMEWPTVRDVNRYRSTVFETVKEIIETHPGLADGHAPIGWDDPLWSLFMGMEHERIHLETSSVLLRETPLANLRKPDAWPDLHVGSLTKTNGSAASEMAMVAVPGGEVEIGKPFDWPTFGWDNEYGSREATVNPFKISSTMVSNGAFLDFVRDGGYHEDRFWDEAGWKWRAFRNCKWPTFWVSDGPAGNHTYKLRTVFDIIDMPMDWPVCANLHEARAYLAWKGERDGKTYRLPTEAEHVLLRNPARRVGASEQVDDAVTKLDARQLAETRTANFNLSFGSEAPVTWSQPDALGIHDIAGNLWDWCEDDFHPLSSFRVHPNYDDFSTPCFDGEHSMILGGSFISTGIEASVWSRFHFRPHFFQHAGFHFVEPAEGETNSGAILLAEESRDGEYETAAMLNQYLLLHFGASDDTAPANLRTDETGTFPERCADLIIEQGRKLGIDWHKAIDVGCSVGGSTFRLAEHFEHVTGIDISAAFIDAAKRLQKQGSLDYQLVVEGDISEGRSATLADAASAAKADFRRADACALPPELTQFDAVLAANLLCRLPSPRAFLSRLGGPRGLVKPGGVVLFASPYTWRESFTTKSAWLGGHDVEGVPMRSFDALAEALEDDFELVHRTDLVAVLREHARKFEYVVSDATLWRRKD